MQSFINRAGWVLAAALGVFVVAALAGVVRGGPLDPPGAPGPTLPQVQPRSPIPPVGWNGTFPIVLSQPGSYFLTRNIDMSTPGNAIEISSNDVSLDLNGFRVDGHGSGTEGIAVTSTINNLRVDNGIVRGWSTGISATFSNTAFAQGGDFEDLQISGNSHGGIRADSGSVIRHVTVEANTDWGIYLSDAGNAYYGGLIEDSVVTRNGIGVEVNANNVTLRRCVIDSSINGGVTVAGAFDVVTDNTIQGTNFGAGVTLTGSSNTVARNIFANVAGGAVQNLGSGNRIGPLDGTLAGTQPWSNAGP